MEQVNLIRAINGDTIEGYAAVYNQPGYIYDTDTNEPVLEQYAPGAFDSALASNDPITFSFGHLEQPYAVRGQNLEVWSDNIGLGYRVTNLPKTAYVAEQLELIARGLYRGSSFIGLPDWEQGSWNQDNGKYVYTVNKVKELYAVDAVALPVHRGTKVSVRGIIRREEQDIFEASRKLWIANKNQSELSRLKNKWK
jgi:HK97 family phage prohead protease